jgi:hypothetical protein
LHTGDIKANIPLKCRLLHLFPLPVQFHVLFATCTPSFPNIWIDVYSLSCQNFHVLLLSVCPVVFCIMCTILFTDSIFIIYLDCVRSTLLQLPFILLVITFLSMSISKVQSSAPTFLCYLFLQHKPFLGHIST